MFGVLAEIVSINGVVGFAKDKDEIRRKLNNQWRMTGTWAIALAAGNADEPMRTVATIDASGNIFWEGN